MDAIKVECRKWRAGRTAQEGKPAPWASKCPHPERCGHVLFCDWAWATKLGKPAHDRPSAPSMPHVSRLLHLIQRARVAATLIGQKSHRGLHQRGPLSVGAAPSIGATTFISDAPPADWSFPNDHLVCRSFA